MADIEIHGDLTLELEAARDDTETIPESKPSNVFGNALQTWTEIDLPAIQRKLDEEGLHLKEDQEALLISRKNLAAETKKYKKLPDDQKLHEFKALLKLYQNEIDALTKKTKQAEGYFFDVYRIFSEAPDPRPLLELSLDAVIESSESHSLREKIIDLQDQLARRADYDTLKQRLLRSEQRSAELLSSKIAAKEDEFKQFLDEKNANWDNKERQLQRQLDEARQRIEELRTNNEVAMLKINAQGGGEEPRGELSGAALVELDMALRDADSYKLRVLDLERRNEDLRRDMAKIQAESNAAELQNEFSLRILELEGENALLAATLDQTRQKLQSREAEKGEEIEASRREHVLLVTENQNLKRKLQETSDYTEIKRELQLLQQLEFGNDVDDDEEGEGRSENLGPKGIDIILVERNKQLSHELAGYRSKHAGLSQTIQSLEAQLETQRQDLVKMHELNARLENDVSSLQDAAENGTGRFSDNASVISGLTKFSRPSMVAPRRSSISQSLIVTGISGNLQESSILPIITKQRDRFKEKNQELEDDLKQQISAINDLKRQLSTLKRDNAELYERTRFMASFKEKSTPSQRPNARILQPKPNAASTLDLEDNRYRQSYESRLNPIEQFRAREQERINSKLLALERVFLAFTRAILATPTTRMLFMAYCLGLHLIVLFITMYVTSLNTSMIAEVGLNASTGGRATGKVGDQGNAR